MSIPRNSRPSIKPTEIPVIVNIQGFKKPHTGPSFVTKDGIMKEVVKLEEEAKSLWVEKYGFLQNNFEQFDEEVEKRGIFYKPPKYRERKKIGQLKECDLPSQLPKTTAGMVGWLASSSQNINVAGPLYVSPKQTMYPPNSMQVFLKKQKFIVLG